MLETDIRTNPFPGLRSFEEDEEYLFFGREKQIDELLKKLRTSRFLAVIGASGSGKSSLVKSGLLPSLHSGYMTTAGSSWRIALFRPGNDPIGNLAKVLSEEGMLYDHQGDDTMYASIIEATLNRSRLGLLEAVKQSEMTKDDNLLVIVDQFEELFRYSKYEEEVHGEKIGSQSFINLLLNSINDKEANIYVGLTMRSDFLGECTQFRNLPEAINEGQYLIPRMTRNDIKQAITGPIAVGGAEVSPRLLTRLLNDVGDSPDQLPILQHALMRTWDYWEQHHKEGEPIDLEHYNAIGTMSKALSLHAEEALADLPTERHKILAELMFRALTDHGGKGQGIRRPTMLKEICDLAEASIEEMTTVIESFRKRGRSLLMPPVGVPLEESTIIDISHESLMRIWTRLKKWDAEETDAVEIYIRLANDAAAYQEGKMGLLSGPELELALKWKNENKPNAKWALRYDPSFERAMTYLEHSKKQNDFEIAQKELEQKRRLKRARRVIMVIGGAAIFFLLMMLYAFQLREEANKERRRAESSEKLAKSAQALAEENENKATANFNRAEEERKNAVRAEKEAKSAKERAEIAAEEARIARNEAISAKKDADRQRDNALINLNRAEVAEEEATRLYEEADSLRLKEEQAKLMEIEARNDAELQRLKTDTLKNLTESRNLSYQALQDINEREFISGAKKAVNAHQLNVQNKGPKQNIDNYKALRAALEGLAPNENIGSFHNQSVRSIAMNSANGLIASGDEGGGIFISTLKDGNIRAEKKLSASGPIRDLEFSPDGEYLVASTFDRTISVWDGDIMNSDEEQKASTKQYQNLIKAISTANISGENYVIVSDGSELIIERITTNGLLEVEKIQIPNVEAILVSNDQNTMLVGSGRKLYEYSIEDAPTLTDPKITELDGTIFSLAISSNKQYLAAGLINGKIYLQDRLSDDKSGSHFTEHYSRVSSLEFHVEDGRTQLISTGFDQTIKMIDVGYLLYQDKDPGEDKITLDAHDKWIHGGMYSADGKFFISIGEDRKIKTWFTKTNDLADAVQAILNKM